MTDSTRATVPGSDLGLQNPRDPVTEPQIGMTYNGAAQPRRPILRRRQRWDRGIVPATGSACAIGLIFANEEVNVLSVTTPTQLPVGHLGFGAMRITGEGTWGPPRDESEALALLRRVVDRGVTFIDTADSYGPGISETLIPKALYPYPAGLVVATKGGLTRPGANRWVTDCRPEHLRLACADSLRRLRLERIELYQLHAVDHRIPIEDSVGALVDLQRDGKIRHIGVSNVSERELARARAVAEIVSVQNCYNLRDRSSDGLIDMCAGAGIAFIPWYPLAAGRLTSPNSPLAQIAQSHGATPSQIALAWLLQRSPAMLPIPGTSSIAHLQENLASASIRLSADEFRTLASL